MIKYANADYPNFGEFVIDGKDPNTILLAQQCQVGSASWCLGATAHKAYNATLPAELRAKSITWQVRRDARTKAVTGGIIGFTYGAWRYTRPMTPFEATLAERFDTTGRMPRRSVPVNLDTGDGRWSREPKAARGGPKHDGNANGAGDRARKRRRAAELQQWLDMRAGRGV